MNVTLRPAAAADDDFLFRLYASTRAEVEALRWTAEQVETFLRMQFNAQRSAYAVAFPNAQHSIIVVDSIPAGRILVHLGEATMSLVDIALVPQFRSHGIGARIIRDLMGRCRENRLPLTLHVATSNPRARALYARLGFVRTGGDAMYDAMRWNPDDKVT